MVHSHRATTTTTTSTTPTTTTATITTAAAAAATTTTTTTVTTTTTTTTTATAAAAAATTTTKPPVPELTYGAWTNYTFTLQAEFQMQFGNPMVSEASPLQLQALQQQQQQQQQQPQMQRKMMMGLGTAEGVGNMGNNMVGLGGLGNAMGMGAAGGIGTGMLAPMTPISGIENVGQNTMNLSQISNITTAISQKLQSGSSPQEAALVERTAQNQANMLGGPQSSLAGISGTRHKHPGSSGLAMLGQTLNKTNMSTMQQAAKWMTGMAGMGMYMNQQQPPQLQQQQSQQQQQQQLQQQQARPQQMSQRTTMRPRPSSLLSSGAIHAMSAGNPDQVGPR